MPARESFRMLDFGASNPFPLFAIGKLLQGG